MARPGARRPSSRLTLFVTLGCVSLLLASLLMDVGISQVRSNPNALITSPDTRLEQALRYFTLPEILQAKIFRLERLRHVLDEQILILAYLFFSVGGLWKKRGPSTLAFFVMFWGALGLLLLPENYYGSYLLEHQFGLSHESLHDWTWRTFKQSLLSLVLVVGLSWAGLWSMRRFGRRWVWSALAIAWATSIGLTFFAPLVIDPIFHHFTPLPEGALRTRLTQMIQTQKLPIREIYVMDASRETRRLNAYVTGFGASQRLVLYDNLVNEQTPEEVALVTAHEFGHWRYHHIAKGLILLLPGLAALLWGCHVLLEFCNAYDWPIQRLLPAVVLALIFFSMLALPLTNAVSRHFERQADAYSLSISGEKKAFRSVHQALARKNLADVLPHPLTVWFFYTHPPTLERLEMAKP